MDIPQSKKLPKFLTSHGERREDPYYWMNQRDHQDVLSHIQQEKAYFNSVMEPVSNLRKTLFEEIKKRIPGKDSSAPYLSNNYLYWTKYEEGVEYPIFCRKKINTEKVSILLDVNLMAKGHKYYDLAETALSFSHNILAFAVDCVGRRFYTIYFKNLQTNEILPLKISDTTGNIVWGNDEQTLFYTKQDPGTLRSHQVFRYDLKTGKSCLVYTEKDPAFHVSVYKTLSKKYIFIQSSSVMTTECRFLPAHQPQNDFKIFQERKRGHRYFVTDGVDRFFILTNSYENKNYRLDQSQLDQQSMEFWKNVLPYNSDIYIEDFEVFENWLALEVRKQGVSEIIFMDRKTNQTHTLPIEGNCRVVELGVNAEYKAHRIRFNYESMVHLDTVYDYDISKKTQTLVKKRKLAVPFDSEKYQCVRKMARVRDGVSVPISLLYRKDQFKKGMNPLYQYGYGAYGHSMEPFFYSHIFSLVDRGFVYAVAHVRGGSELGKHWYEQGRLLHKKNTFYDFIDCSEYLIQEGFAHSKKVYAGGGSAGGLLMGSILNLRPDLYKAIIAHVPFVDVLTTMEDQSIPLTTGEYDEWGNPQDQKYYEYIKSYSPYDNVQPNDFPYVLATAGYHDSQVQYWEPMKWLSRLRDCQKGEQSLLLYMNTDSGHSGETGRFNQLKLLAMEYAFLLNLENIKVEN